MATKSTTQKAQDTKTILTIPGPKVGWTDLLDHRAMEDIKEDAARRRGAFPLRPSSAGQCARKLGYELQEYQAGKPLYEGEQKSPATRRLLNLGYHVERAVVWDMKLLKGFAKAKYLQQVVTIMQIKDGPLIEGSLDLVLKADGTVCLMDVKSAKDKFDRFYATKWDATLAKFGENPHVVTLSDTAFFIKDLPAFMKEHNDPFLNDNLYQLNLYGCTDFAKERNVDHCSIYKYNKNDSRHYELRWAPCEATSELVKEKFERVYTTLKEGKPKDIARDYGLGNIKCAFCPYNGDCWGKDKEAIKKEFYRTLPKKRWPKDTDRLDSGAELEDSVH